MSNSIYSNAQITVPFKTKDMTPTEYKICTVQDMIDCTNDNNIDRLLKDLKIHIQLAQNFKLESDGLTWIDDGKDEYEIIIKPK